MKELNSIIQKVMIDLGLAKPFTNHQVYRRWEEIVGPIIAKQTEIVDISYNRLIVRVKSPAWRQELIYQKRKILRKIKERIKDTTINDIVFK